MSSHNRNPSGHNQFSDQFPSADDEALAEALRMLQREKVTSLETMAERLHNEWKFPKMSAKTVGRRRQALGLSGPRKTNKHMPDIQKTQLVLEQLERDPAANSSANTINHRIAERTGIQLPRDFTNHVMHTHAPEGFQKREPAAKKLFRVKKTVTGTDFRWSCDGHDKLYKIGYPIWGITDDGSSKWHSCFVVPSNRFGNVIVVLWLKQVLVLGGMAVQTTTDCGSETTVLHGVVKALRAQFFPDYSEEDIPAHKYVPSYRNITQERSWLRLRQKVGDNAVIVFHEGIESGVYKPDIPLHQMLCNFVFPKFLRQEIASFIFTFNAQRIPTDRNKAGPSGMSRNEAYSNANKWGGIPCLLSPTPAQQSHFRTVVQELIDEYGGEGVLDFLPVAFTALAEAKYSSLGITELRRENVWEVFQQILAYFLDLGYDLELEEE